MLLRQRPRCDRTSEAIGWPVALATLPLALIGLAIVWLPLLPNSAGRMGADYSVWLADLLAGFFWFEQNGFSGIPWFNPAQCGGVPLAADPQGAYFSLPQFLTFVLPPVQAVRVSFLAFGAAGYLGCFRLARAFGVSRAAALLAGALFAFNSFYGARMVVGHLSFAPFMLLPAAACCLIGGQAGGRDGVAGGILRCGGFAILFAAMFQGGMLVLIPVVTLSVLMVVALHAVVAHSTSLRPLWRLGAGTLLSLLLCAGKLAAVLSLMAHVPRDAYALPGYLSVGETLWVALRALFVGPADDMHTHLANASVLFERHEFEYSVGPACLLLLLAGVVLAWRQRAWPARPQRLALDALLLMLLVPLALNTYGEAWTGLLKALPVLRQSSSLLRWFAAYMLPAVLAAGVALDRLCAALRWSGWPVAGVAAGVTLAGLLLADHSSYGPGDIGAFDPATIESSWHAVARSGVVPAVREIAVLTDKAGRPDKMSLARQDGMAAGQSQLFCYDPLFGYHLEHFPQGALHPGGVFEQSGAGLNLKNPACYVFPGANQCRPGDAFAATEIDQAARFVSYRPFLWRKPVWARVADWAGYVTWPLTCLALIAALWIGKRARRQA